MEEIDLLIEDYQRRLVTINKEKELNKGKMKSIRLEVKASCYRYFLVELNRIKKLLDSENSTIENGICPNCGEIDNGNCACMRNKCIKCGNPVGNVTFTVCDECWDKEYKK